jgi:ribosome-binding ATPase
VALQIGIVGLPNVGKSTLFQALTQKQVDAANYPFATIEPNVGIVELIDPRLDALADLSKSQKKIPAVIEFVDIAGLVKGAHSGEGLGNQFLANIREVDAIVEVVRDFEDSNIVHVDSSINPKRDRETIALELIMADLITAEKAVGRAEKEAKTGNKDSKQYLEDARYLVSELKDAKKPTNLDLANSLQLMSSKPVIVLYNTKEDPHSSAQAESDAIIYNSNNTLHLNIKLEDELSKMSIGEQKELGLEPRLSELARAAYDKLGLISFFTTGPVETRAWTIPQDSTAKRAGRAIHSDFEEKFIRAEVIFWKDLLDAGSVAKARDKGLMRTEGKDYIVKDGDVVEFKI